MSNKYSLRAHSMHPVTILMPVYNEEKYLEGALTILCSQTFSDFNVIISDNASTDSTPDIISTWAARDSRITFHRQNENIGPTLNFEWVLRAAQSPWVMFAACDDLWSPNYVEVLYKAIIAEPSLKLAAPLIVQMDRDGNETRRRRFYDPISDASGLMRVVLLLKSVRSAWYYGMFD